MQTLRLDAAESAFVARQLEFISSQTYDVKFPALKARQLIPVNNEANAGANEVTYGQFEEFGEAQIGAGALGKDAPRVDVAMNEFPRPVKSISASWGWNVQEMKAAAMANVSLDARRATAGRKAIERALDQVAAVGAPLQGIATGFVNDANVNIDAATGNWSGLTAVQIVADISTMYQEIRTASLDIEEPDTLVLPPAQHGLISTLQNSASSDVTVLNYVLANFPGLKSIESWSRLTGAGAGAVDRAVMYRRDPDSLTQDIPLDFEQMAPQAQGTEFVVYAYARTAGTVFYYPGSADYMDGI